jgi:hypothetical protein|tara:strand:+ start:428 stop:559 length:132 start_codon:yes stop_codon:yes gene_type:complete
MVTPVLLQPAVSLRVVQRQKNRQLAQQTDGYVSQDKPRAFGGV